MISSGKLDQPRAGDVLREITAVFDPPEQIANAMQDERRGLDRGQHGANVRMGDQLVHRPGDGRTAGAFTRACPPRPELRIVGERGCTQRRVVDGRALIGRIRYRVDPMVEDALGHAPRIVDVACHASLAMHQHLGGDPLGVRRAEHERDVSADAHSEQCGSATTPVHRERPAHPAPNRRSSVAHREPTGPRVPRRWDRTGSVG